MMNVQVFKNDVFNVAVRENGNSIELDAESVARSLGFIQIKKNKEYVRWERVNEYLTEFGFPHVVGKDDFIPESYTYLLGMKGENEAAINFQKFIAFDVLPAIRKNKVYIDPSATDKEIDAAVRFATPQKRRTALLDATIDGKDSIFNVYDDIKEYMKRWTADEKVTAYKHIERVLLDKQDTYGKDVAFIHKVEELLRQVAKDIDKVKNWKNGAEKRVLGKENKQLRQHVNKVISEPSLEDYYEVNYPPFSVNYMYEWNEKAGKMVKSYAFKKWLSGFPYHELPYDPGVDFNRNIKVYLAFVHKQGTDVQNMEKAVNDLLAKHFDYDDIIIDEVRIKSVGRVEKHEMGKIYFAMRNV